MLHHIFKFDVSVWECTLQIMSVYKRILKVIAGKTEKAAIKALCYEETSLFKLYPEHLTTLPTPVQKYKNIP